MALVISCRTALLQNYSQYLLLNVVINATRDIFENTKKITRTESNEKKIGKKSKRKRVSSSIIYIVLFANVFIFLFLLLKGFLRSFVPPFPLLLFRIDDIKAATGGVL